MIIVIKILLTLFISDLMLWFGLNLADKEDSKVGIISGRILVVLCFILLVVAIFLIWLAKC